MIRRKIEIDDPLLREIGRLADRQRTGAYVVGGYVRDLLIGREVKDIDIIVVGDGIRFAEQVAAELKAGPVVSFEKFGTAMLPLGARQVEFVGARSESYDGASRKPVVAIGTIEDDLARRDFRCNAIAASLNTDTLGGITDPFDGQSDIRRGILRTPLDPATTFSEDPLRMLRAFRFAAQLGFSVHPESLSVISGMRERLRIVSTERTSEELLKTLAAPKPSVGLLLMYEHGLMEIVFGEICQMAGVDQRNDHHHKDVFLHTCQVVDNVAETSDHLWLRFAALVHDIAKPRTKAFKPGTGWTFHGHEEIGARMMKGIFRRLRFPFEHLPYVEKLVRLHLRPQALVSESVSDSAIRRLVFEAGETIDDLMLLCRADITTKNPRLVSRYLRNYDIVVVKIREVEEKDRLRTWQPPVKGDEIMQICGIRPGKKVGILKKAIEEAILEGEIPNEHDAAVEFLMKMKDSILDRPETAP